MAGNVRTYDPGKVMVIAGTFPLEGFSPESIVSIEPLGELVTAQVGSDGEIARSINRNKMHSVTITLLQTSASNDVLNGLAAADEASGGGIMFPILVQDLLGRSRFAAAQAWVSKRPTQGHGNTAGTREWVLHTGEPSVNVIGGNT